MLSFDLFGFLPFSLLDLIDIVLVAFLMYKIYELVKGTNAVRIFLGLLAFYLIYRLVDALEMQLTREILRQFINVGVIAFIIVFQQEIRRFLLALGNTRFFQGLASRGGIWSWLGQIQDQSNNRYQEVARAAFSMGATKTGALMVFEGSMRLNSVIETGKKLNADVSQTLIESIFFKNSPMHDGAMVIRESKVVAAACMLPLSIRKDLHRSYGMRHRAAIGASEEYDAISVVVSEETGRVSLVAGGVSKNMRTEEELVKAIIHRKESV